MRRRPDIDQAVREFWASWKALRVLREGKDLSGQERMAYAAHEELLAFLILHLEVGRPRPRTVFDLAERPTYERRTWKMRVPRWVEQAQKITESAPLVAHAVIRNKGITDPKEAADVFLEVMSAMSERAYSPTGDRAAQEPAEQ